MRLRVRLALANRPRTSGAPSSSLAPPSAPLRTLWGWGGGSFSSMACAHQIWCCRLGHRALARLAPHRRGWGGRGRNSESGRGDDSLPGIAVVLRMGGALGENAARVKKLVGVSLFSLVFHFLRPRVVPFLAFLYNFFMAIFIIKSFK